MKATRTLRTVCILLLRIKWIPKLTFQTLTDTYRILQINPAEGFWNWKINLLFFHPKKRPLSYMCSYDSTLWSFQNVYQPIIQHSSSYAKVNLVYFKGWPLFLVNLSYFALNTENLCEFQFLVSNTYHNQQNFKSWS